MAGFEPVLECEELPSLDEIQEDSILPVEIERAIKRKKLFESNPRKHTYEAEAESKKTSDAITILDRMAGDSPELRRLTEEAKVSPVLGEGCE